MRRHVVAALGACSLIAAAIPASVQAIPVFDAGNHVQNVLIAARTLEQINQQIRSLQNEAEMLANMARNLEGIDFPQLEALRSRLQEINRLMGEARGVDFRIDALDERFRQLFPDGMTGGEGRVARARERLEAAMSALRQTMGVQNRIVANVRDDAQDLARIVARSQGAQGSLAAQQATNQLLAVAAQQQLQLQQLLASQFRAEAIDQADRRQVEREARETTRRFLGDGRAYTPDPR